MLPSSTVENYLKALYQAETSRGNKALVPMGQLATAVGVAPGTATTMVKALADSGLVLRRHRLVEQFLVEVVGMSWAEVHEDAEQLEHVVSDRLIERMDAMLGHPAVDPHGDPIPTPDGNIAAPDYHSLLTCPLHVEVTVTRVTDQDASFLTFLEKQDLKPGQSLEVEARDSAADSVQLRTGTGDQVTIGTRAASKVLIEVSEA